MRGGRDPTKILLPVGMAAVSQRAKSLKESTSGVRCSAMRIFNPKFKGSVVGPAFRPGVPAFDSTHARTDDLPPSEKGTREVTAVLQEDLDALLKSAFAKKGYDINAVLRPPGHFDDDRYYLPTLGELGAVVGASPTQKLGSEEDIFDCEDFAYVFRGFAAQHHFLDETKKDTLAFAVGMIWGQGIKGLNPLPHAVNFSLCADESVWLIDTSRAATLEPSPIGAGSTLSWSLQQQVLTPLAPDSIEQIHYIVI